MKSGRFLNAELRSAMVETHKHVNKSPSRRLHDGKRRTTLIYSKKNKKNKKRSIVGGYANKSSVMAFKLDPK